jgi:hypothetical protein
VKQIAATAALAVFLGACSGGPETFKEVDQLVAALQDGGVECTNVHTGGGAQLVKESGSCAAAGQALSLFLFSSEKDRDDWLQVGGSFGSEVVGPNWVVIAPDGAAAKEVAEALDGEVGGDE